MPTIIHADLDAFYASVEQLDNPELRGKPVVVGGPPESRGVVAAASYEARKFGVRSATPMSRAVKLCPDLVRISPRFPRYIEISRDVMAIFRAVTPLVEPLSLDEAYLDVSGWVDDGAQPRELAASLKQEVRTKTQLTLSVGVGTSKSVAKIASDIDKPDGLHVVAPGDEAAFLAPLPIRTLWGVGPKTERRMVDAGIRTIGDLARKGDGEAMRLLGSGGVFMRDLARGIDPRPVETSYERKSVGAETTFARDLPDGPELRAELRQIAEETAHRLRAVGATAHTVAIKLRYSYFKTITRQASVKVPVDDADAIAEIALRLLDAVAEEDDRFRLLGIQCSKLEGGDLTQGRLFAGREGYSAEL